MAVLIDKQVAIDALGEQGLITAMIVIDRLPSVQPEITEDDVKEYCRKRHLIVVTSDFYADELERIKQAMKNTPVMLLPPTQPTLYGYNIEHLKLIAQVLQKEDLSPERVAEALTDIGRIVDVVRHEFEEALRRAVTT